ncbi:hypothetical protein [Mycolicibacterium diernhoferi]|uniref:Uncharacterized protein n=1 Tax=Mycolicibacterium diernhoferi TaxID=1801 RepID=A0A1Q4H8Z9_9MYCO|nr:hypothetical protein [Mycolicibacterium diernhoferi]OJZ63983.1 hypothetical protein BRW64_19825 [Mycolicibacterium diernhoferi]OPE54138.1 hypothetical protein BV510_11885 [Mycolicibacterium diernhoferi]PEG55633.1 hypothetical protein CRI78_05065 [Mycolicibacterium diernhoferi]QYL20671.1 hypothetical protein K0O62_16445 [Mycolicibacterium diernhoferi]
MDSSSPSEPPAADAALQYLSYEEFGRRFFEVAVTEKRVADAIGAIAGEEFEMGPMGQGPGGIAKVTARVKVQAPRVTRQVGRAITFDIRIPLEIKMVVDLRIDKPRFQVFGEIALTATARAAAPLLLIIDVDRPGPRDISIHVTSGTLRAEVLRVLAGIDAEIKRFIAAHVVGEIDSLGARQARIIDIATQIDAGWAGM